MADRLTIVEVGPRDGLQNDPVMVPTAVKVELIERLVAAGLDAIEITSFVRADRIPKLADADEVVRAVHMPPAARIIALAPNVAGLERAIGTLVNEVAVFAAASDTFNQRNIGRPTAAALDMFRPVAEEALAAGLRVRGYVSTVLGCPYQGDVPLSDVCAVAEALVAMGCHEVSLGDTIGIGNPSGVRAMVAAVADAIGLDRIAVHMHDTYGMGLANTLAAIEAGVRVADTSIGGLGGCPF
ncbi:MAG TPA: hydroxymethylglutaryl-CoA lyase, partial [Ilumatobacteraceae bacterium]|nr:hydroxymethylglutaryl-CoA lyase [Ilumatobacteraceae bacterium]